MVLIEVKIQNQGTFKPILPRRIYLVWDKNKNKIITISKGKTVSSHIKMYYGLVDVPKIFK